MGEALSKLCDPAHAVQAHPDQSRRKKPGSRRPSNAGEQNGRQTEASGKAQADELPLDVDNYRELEARLWYLARGLQLPEHDPNAVHLVTGVGHMLRFVMIFLKNERDNWRIELRQEQDVRQRLNDRIGSLQKDVHARDEAIRNRDGVIESWKIRYNQELDVHARAMRDLRQDHDHRLQLHSGEAEMARLRLERQIDEERGQHSHLVRGLEASAEQEKIQLNKQWASTLEARQTEMNELGREHARLFSELEARSAAEKAALITKHDTTVAALHQEYTSEMRSQEKKSRLEREALIEQHKNNTVKIRQQAEHLHSVLLHQDQEVFMPALFRTTSLPQESDKGIATKFQEVRRLVEELSRTRWKDQTSTWSAADLQRASARHPERLVKIAILEDMIWTTLYHHIFCSPFRMLGALGKQLEKDWPKAYGITTGSSDKSLRSNRTSVSLSQVPVAPSPGAEVERWRYMTLLGCHEALSSNMTAQDTRGEVKKGWVDSQSELCQALSQELWTVLDMQDVKIAAIKRICESAAQTWLGFAMHRCRIELSLLGSDRTLSEKLTTFNTVGSLKLTKSPSIARYGNPKGGELETYSVVADCAGVALAIP